MPRTFASIYWWLLLPVLIWASILIAAISFTPSAKWPIGDLRRSVTRPYEFAEGHEAHWHDEVSPSPPTPEDNGGFITGTASALPLGQLGNDPP